MCEDQTGLELTVGQKVIIVGEITAISNPPGADFCVATVRYTQNTSAITKPFHGDELVKAEIENNIITGIISNPT